MIILRPRPASARIYLYLLNPNTKTQMSTPLEVQQQTYFFDIFETKSFCDSIF